ncbi:MAG TPA: multidrug ABC transporter ATP-binding protein [Clostridiales bacterium]|nr:multidrug ABC transporter ATP-binding protein [Clostridiales bacterium]
MVKFLMGLLKPYAWLLVVVIALQVGQALLSLYLPTINAGIIDYGVIHADTDYIMSQGGLMVGLSLVQFVCALLASILGAKIALSAGRDLRGKLYERILSFSQREIGILGAPTLITRATNDVQQIVQFMIFLFTVIINAPIMFVGGIFMAFSQDVSLSMVIVVALPILAVISILFIVKLVPHYRVQQERIDDVNSVLRDQISGIRVAKAFVKESHEEEKLGGVNSELFRLNVSIGRMTTILPPIFMFVVNVATIVLLWYGGLRAEVGDVQIGQIIAFITYMSFILTAALLASLVFIMMPRAEVSAERIKEVLDTKSSVREATTPAARPARGVVQFDGAGFSYAPDNPDVEPVLKEISFTAQPGQMTAIIGSTGCGKTTLLNLIPRLADVTQGAVRFDGEDVRNYNIADLDEAIGMVPQKAFLFSGTLEQNLRHAKPDATDDELWEALRIAQAEEFVRESEGGLSMRVAEGGSNFSGGQRQRLAIARAIVRRPNVYIFDDSFSALDYATDRNLRAALKEITAESAVIVVAQRITSISRADQIVVMNNGAVEDIGTHEELLARCRTYQEIAASQPSEQEQGVTA